jgi:hypothetical protein
MIAAGGRTVQSEIHKLINFIWNKDELPRSGTMYPSIRRAMKQTVVIIGAQYFCELHTKFYTTFCSQG